MKRKKPRFSAAWLSDNRGDYFCSACRRYAPINPFIPYPDQFKYCPYCGLPMVGVVED